MQKIGFAEALDSIVAADNRYLREAYVVLRDALDYTTNSKRKPTAPRASLARRRQIQGFIASLFSSGPRSSRRLEHQCAIATAREVEGAKRDCRFPGGLF